MPLYWKREPELLESLTAAVPEILGSQKPDGRFGTEPWIATDQNVLLALAAAWHLPESPHHHDAKVLDAIVRGGQALIDAQDETGMWTFRKKDGSTWGQIYQPWTYSRWVRAFRLTRQAMPADARGRWEKAMRLGFDGIARTAMTYYHNIPTHHAMALYCAGEVFGKEEWRRQARDFMGVMTSRQSPHGWWSEHVGPVVGYNFVYVEAMGLYYGLSGDEQVLPALERAARYHANFTYPDGSAVETVDERNQYEASIRLGNVGFSHTPIGRGFLLRQHALHVAAGRRFPADHAANMLLEASEGPAEPTAADRDRHSFRMGDEAVILRRKPWFCCVSGYVCEVSDSRWIQDRQNFVSVYHDRVGLILGGGNTKLQPLWSAFTVGGCSSMRHVPGDEDPDFRPKVDLLHVPDKATIDANEDAPALTLRYGPETCGVRIEPRDDATLKIRLESTTLSPRPVEAHLTLLPDMARPLRLASGEELDLNEDSLAHTARQAGWIEHAGWRLSFPAGSMLSWPVLPHDPYRKGGEARTDQGRIVLTVPFSASAARRELTLEVR